VRLLARIEELEAKLNRNSSNSNKPPSSDSPFTPKPEATKKSYGKPNKRHGSRQQCLRPTELMELHSEQCSCGCRDIDDQKPYYIIMPNALCASLCYGVNAASAPEWKREIVSWNVS